MGVKVEVSLSIKNRSGWILICFVLICGVYICLFCQTSVMSYARTSMSRCVTTKVRRIRMPVSYGSPFVETPDSPRNWIKKDAISLYPKQWREKIRKILNRQLKK